MKAGYCTILVTTWLPICANAEMPRYNVESYCKEIAAAGGTYSEMMNDSCFDMEQSSYDNLKPRWDSLPPKLQSYCDEIAKFGGGGSYMMLESCVQMEEQAGSTKNTFKY